jgi:mannose-6-phosphate isomerase-like protein (cupin superfamily)
MRLSLQRQKYLAEHWFIVSGLGLARLENKVIKVQQGNSVDIPIGAKQRITYASDHPLFLSKSRLESVFIKTILPVKKMILVESNL